MSSFLESSANLSKAFDHTVLKAETDEATVLKVCSEAKTYDFASVCVNSCHVPLVAQALQGSTVKVCAVVGFPLGAMSSAGKAAEARDCGKNGANEIDMVINVGWLKSGKDDLVRQDIEAVVAACREFNMALKVIIETCLLTPDEKVRAANIALDAGADFVKTSTGFSTAGAQVDDVQTLSSICHARGKFFKASGGIRDGQQAYAMLQAGADRLGTSATVKAFEECKAIIEGKASASSASHSASASKDLY